MSCISTVVSSYLFNPCPICTAPVILILFDPSANVAPKFFTSVAENKYFTNSFLSLMLFTSV